MKNKEFNPDNFINFGSVSRLFTNDRSSITRKRISPKHKENIDKLRKAITEWHKSL